MKAGDMVMVGIAPRYNGYAGVMGDTLPVSGEYTQEQKDCINVIREVFRKTRDALKPGETGKTLDPIGAKIYEKHDWTKYIVCPFVHGLGLMEAERPFFGPNGTEVIKRTCRVVCIRSGGSQKWKNNYQGNWNNKRNKRS